MSNTAYPIKTILLLLLTLCTACTPIERIPERSMTVTQGPDRVFDKPLGEILPELNNAIPTGNNGRVGNELVFWGFQLEDNREVSLFSCALLDNVNCDIRIRAICPGQGEELKRIVETGNVRHVDCPAIGIIGPGGTSACNDRIRSTELVVGLMQCQ